MSDANGFLRCRTVFPRRSTRRQRQTTRALTKVVHGRRVSLVTVNGNATDHRASTFIKRILGALDSPPIGIFIGRSKTSVCSTDRITTTRFPSLSIAIQKTVDVTQQLRSPLTRLIGVSPGSVNIKRCRRSISRGQLGRGLSRAVRDYIGCIKMSLGVTSHRLLACMSNVAPTITGGVIRCHGTGNTFRSQGSLLGIGGLNPGTFRRTTNFLQVHSNGGPLSGATIRPRDCPVISRVTTSLKVPLTRVPRTASHLGQLRVHQCAARATKRLALRSVLRRLRGPNHSPHRRFACTHFRRNVGRVASLGPNVALRNAIAGIAGFKTFISIKIRRSKLIRVSRLTSHFIDSPGSVIGIKRIIGIQILRMSAQLGQVNLSVGRT